MAGPTFGKMRLVAKPDQDNFHYHDVIVCQEREEVQVKFVHVSIIRPTIPLIC